jgi:DNA adenine methylase
MQYFGGKYKIAEKIADRLYTYGQKANFYWEPFVGSGVVLEKIDYLPRFASDRNVFLIAMFQALQKGWIPPFDVDENLYGYTKTHKYLDKALTGFIGFGCSFGGKFFGGYARNKNKDNYAFRAAKSLMLQLPYIRNVDFMVNGYQELDFFNGLIYCDPPYANTTGYHAVGNFDPKHFWMTAREWSQKNYVLISEYTAPDDFLPVFATGTSTSMRDSSGKTIQRREKMFAHRDGLALWRHRKLGLI